jgi:signal transduction histidine kinase
MRVLVVEDNADDAELMLRELRRGGFEVTSQRVDTRDAMAQALDMQAWDIVLADYTMPSFNARAALALVQEKGMDVPFIIISGSIGEEIAVDAMKAGAHDYLMKGNLARLVPVIEREIREAASRRERRSLEAQLQQAQKMELIGQLAGGIAHDFNNVLTVIQGNIELIEDAIAPSGPTKECLEDAAKATKNGAGLARQLLAFAREQVIEPEIVDLNELIQDTVKLLRRVIGENVKCVTLAQPDLRPVRVDPGQMTQVLVNLALNARDAMPSGGELTIETQNLQMNEEQARQRIDVRPGEYVLLSVRDSGTGMNEKVLARIFEPYFTTKEPGKGTGFGLATCYGIIKQSGGSIWAESRPGQGTKFQILLPRAE